MRFAKRSNQRLRKFARRATVTRQTDLVLRRRPNAKCIGIALLMVANAAKTNVVKPKKAPRYTGIPFPNPTSTTGYADFEPRCLLDKSKLKVDSNNRAR